jgi:hypothetical protein
VASGIAYQLQGKITDDTKTTVNTPITTKKTMTALTQSHGPQLSTFSSLKKIMQRTTDFSPICRINFEATNKHVP